MNGYEKSYVFASCKKWHEPLYRKMIQEVEGNWTYVSNRDELSVSVSRLKPKYVFFVHWSWLVPEIIWQNHTCVCFHMTDLPFGRGGSPLQNLVMTGHDHTVLTAFRMVNEIDAGPVYVKRPLSLAGSAEEIYIRAGWLSGEIMKWMIEHDPNPLPQQGEPVLFKRRSPEQSVLPNHGSISKIHDFIRMLDAEGYPKAFIDHGDYVIHFRKARMEGDCVVAEVEIKLQNKL